MKRIAMISNEFAPHKCHGGLGKAVERLGRQLVSLRSEVNVHFPMDGVSAKIEESNGSAQASPYRMPRPVTDDTETALADYMTHFCEQAMSRIDASVTDSVVVHDNEAAVAVPLYAKIGPPVTYWLHSLYDHPRRIDYPAHVQALMNRPSAMASAINVAGVVVTSSGILEDADRIRWPHEVREVQTALSMAQAAGRVCEVESLGCMPEIRVSTSRHTVLSRYGLGQRPYILFPGRPVVSKGIGFLQAIAERMRSLDADFVSVGEVADEIRRNCPDVQWIPWIESEQLFAVMTGAAAVLHPSLTEGYGLAAAESCLFNSNTICNSVGGLRILAKYNLALSIEPTNGELETLYKLWARLLSAGSGEYWKLWKHHEPRLERLIDKWVQALHAAIEMPNRGPRNVAAEGVSSWGASLLRRL